MHQAGTFIRAAQRVVHSGSRNQLALGRLLAETFRADDDLAAQRNAVLILKDVVMQSCGR